MSNKIKKTKASVFITGATGLVGSYLLKILLQSKYKVYALGRSKNSQSADKRIISLLNFWDTSCYGKYRKNLKILDGDITKSDLGISKKENKILRQDVLEIFHSAAITDINWPLDKIRPVNVNGTENIINFALLCKNFKKINHISTTYVCGNFNGEFKETDLDVGQEFNNSYEQSKFEAETIVQSFRNKVCVDIYRLPIIVGDSRFGRILQFRNIYQFLRICILQLFDSLPVINSRINLVTIDEAARAVYSLSNQAKFKNYNYHIFSNDYIPIAYFIDVASIYFGFKKPRISSIEDFSKKDLTSAQKEILKRNIQTFNLSVSLNSKFTEVLLNTMSFNFTKFDKKLFNKLFYYFCNKKK